MTQPLQNHSIRVPLSGESELLGCNVCSPVEVHPRFSGMYCRHLKGRRLSQASNQEDTGIAYILLNHSLVYVSVLLFYYNYYFSMYTKQPLFSLKHAGI
jgi:hypothetical protein